MRVLLMSAVAVLLASSTAVAADVAKGKELYDGRCSFCHGSDGKGDGPAGAALQPRPTDFTAASFWKVANAEMIRFTITNGKPGTAMIPFGQTLKPGEIDDLTAYLQTLK